MFNLHPKLSDPKITVIVTNELVVFVSFSGLLTSPFLFFLRNATDDYKNVTIKLRGLGNIDDNDKKKEPTVRICSLV